MIAQSFYIAYPVRSVRQWDPMGCWAAALAMIQGREWCTAAPSEIIESGGLSANPYQSSGVENMRRLAAMHDLVFHAPMSWSIEEIADLVETYGPLMMGGRIPARHFVVVGGIWGDGTPETTTLKIYEPSPYKPESFACTWKEWFDFYRESSEWIVHRRCSAYERQAVPLR